MASPRALARLDVLIWVLVYAGLFAIVLGVVLRGENLAAAWSLGIAGVLVAASGAVLLWVRSRMSEDAAAGAQSKVTQGKP